MFLGFSINSQYEALREKKHLNVLTLYQVFLTRLSNRVLQFSNLRAFKFDPCPGGQFRTYSFCSGQTAPRFPKKDYESNFLIVEHLTSFNWWESSNGMLYWGALLASSIQNVL